VSEEIKATFKNTSAERVPVAKMDRMRISHLRKGEKEMKKLIVKVWFGVVLGFALAVIGCASHYYKVTDPQSGSTYYTQEIENLKGGAVKLKDARSGSLVTLQNSEVKEISSQQYEAGLTAPVYKSTPVAAPTATPSPAAAPIETPAQAPASPAPATTQAPSSAPSGT